MKLADEELKFTNDEFSKTETSKFRSRNGRLSSVVVFEVNEKSFKAIWPYLMISIKEANFISLDLELSGLGERRGWTSCNIEERYQAIRKGAKTRSIVSVGISTFKMVKRKETRKKKRIKLQCNVFNILTFYMEPFVVEPSGLQFLVKNNFDLNRLVKVGVPYYPPSSAQENPLRALWEQILGKNVPLTFHNGLVDLAFLYQHFYGELPELLSEFITNISDWFDEKPGNFFDSKYLAEFHVRMKASYLEYVFRKCQRENALEASFNRLYISTEFNSAALEVPCLAEAVEIVDCVLPEGFYEAVVKTNNPNKQERNSICPKHAAFGFCHKREKCPLLHNIDAVLDAEEQKQMKLRLRRKRRYDFVTKGIRIEGEEIQSFSRGDAESEEKFTSATLEEVELSEAEDNHYRNQKPYLMRSEIGCHRAGVDSFMTGFSVAFMSRMSLLRDGVFDPGCCNRLPLPGKTLPLVIRVYEHTEKTAEHLEKWQQIQKERNRAKQLQLIS